MTKTLSRARVASKNDAMHRLLALRGALSGASFRQGLHWLLADVIIRKSDTELFAVTRGSDGSGSGLFGVFALLDAGLNLGGNFRERVFDRLHVAKLIVLIDRFQFIQIFPDIQLRPPMGDG